MRREIVANFVVQREDRSAELSPKSPESAAQVSPSVAVVRNCGVKQTVIFGAKNAPKMAPQMTTVWTTTERARREP
jgi:hypothetical protein